MIPEAGKHAVRNESLMFALIAAKAPSKIHNVTILNWYIFFNIQFPHPYTD